MGPSLAARLQGPVGSSVQVLSVEATRRQSAGGRRRHSGPRITLHGVPVKGRISVGRSRGAAPHRQCTHGEDPPVLSMGDGEAEIKSFEGPLPKPGMELIKRVVDMGIGLAAGVSTLMQRLGWAQLADGSPLVGGPPPQNTRKSSDDLLSSQVEYLDGTDVASPTLTPVNLPQRLPSNFQRHSPIPVLAVRQKGRLPEGHNVQAVSAVEEKIKEIAKGTIQPCLPTQLPSAFEKQSPILPRLTDAAAQTVEVFPEVVLLESSTEVAGTRDVSDDYRANPIHDSLLQLETSPSPILEEGRPLVSRNAEAVAVGKERLKEMVKQPYYPPRLPSAFRKQSPISQRRTDAPAEVAQLLPESSVEVSRTADLVVKDAGDPIQESQLPLPTAPIAILESEKPLGSQVVEDVPVGEETVKEMANGTIQPCFPPRLPSAFRKQSPISQRSTDAPAQAALFLPESSTEASSIVDVVGNYGADPIQDMPLPLPTIQAPEHGRPLGGRNLETIPLGEEERLKEMVKGTIQPCFPTRLPSAFRKQTPIPPRQKDAPAPAAEVLREVAVTRNVDGGPNSFVVSQLPLELQEVVAKKVDTLEERINSHLEHGEKHPSSNGHHLVRQNSKVRASGEHAEAQVSVQSGCTSEDLASYKLPDLKTLASYKLPDLKSLAKARGLKGYSKLRKAELIVLLRATQN